ncbi:MAG: hypothetical protein ABL929_02430 [Ferruginibacter sp.]|nr:hypothetical protein [Ferruginibacter sp.]
MQDIEPYYNWRHIYVAAEDAKSPLYKRQYNEFEYTNTVYNYFIHPQWDEFGSNILYLKILFVDYEQHYAIIELIGEWNDAIENDIMLLRRNITDNMYKTGIYKFILIAENVLNFHSSDDSYYEEWNEQIADENGWLTIINLPEQSKYDFKKARITNYISFLEIDQWRTLKPEFIFALVNEQMCMRLY